MGLIAAVWGFGGIFVFLAFAIYRLSLLSIDAAQFPMHWYHWLTGLVWLYFMLYNEGYKGFQKGFSPRVAARVLHVYRYPSAVRLVLAPVYCMGFFGIERKRLIITWCVTLGIVVLVQLVGLLAQPWRGIVDFGVVAGLVWGLVTFGYFTYKAFSDPEFSHSPMLPDAQVK